MKTDIFYMKRALELAELGAGKVSTNPMVGAVIVHDGEIIGEGWHARFGGPHAEVNAIANVENKSLLEDSTMYVTLEPCCHFGKTPPCADLIIKHRFKRVVVAMRDTFSLVSGGGLIHMRSAGLEVETGLLEKEARWLNRRFIVFHEKKRPYIIIKYARTADGYIDNDRDATEPAPWITGYACRLLVHRWRAEEDAVMVGTNTVLRDNPTLTVREWFGRNPIRVTIDKRNILPSTSNIFNDESQTLVFSGENIDEMLAILYGRGVQSILLEGGKTLIESFVSSGNFDEVREFVSPLTLADLPAGHGGEGIHAPLITGLETVSTKKIGDVTLIIKRPEEAV